MITNFSQAHLHFRRCTVIHKWTASFMMTVGIVILFLPRTISAQTQEPVPENDANCVACHEHQYYLYDQGKWFCLCEAPMHCVYCHSGRTDSSVKEIAHEGLVLYPTRDQATRCQTCHSEACGHLCERGWPQFNTGSHYYRNRYRANGYKGCRSTKSIAVASAPARALAVIWIRSDYNRIFWNSHYRLSVLESRLPGTKQPLISIVIYFD